MNNNLLSVPTETTDREVLGENDAARLLKVSELSLPLYVSVANPRSPFHGVVHAVVSIYPNDNALKISEGADPMTPAWLYKDDWSWSTDGVNWRSFLREDSHRPLHVSYVELRRNNGNITRYNATDYFGFCRDAQHVPFAGSRLAVIDVEGNEFLITGTGWRQVTERWQQGMQTGIRTPEVGWHRDAPTIMRAEVRIEGDPGRATLFHAPFAYAKIKEELKKRVDNELDVVLTDGREYRITGVSAGQRARRFQAGVQHQGRAGWHALPIPAERIAPASMSQESMPVAHDPQAVKKDARAYAGLADQPRQAFPSSTIFNCYVAIRCGDGGVEERTIAWLLDSLSPAMAKRVISGDILYRPVACPGSRS